MSASIAEMLSNSTDTSLIMETPQGTEVVSITTNTDTVS